MLSKLPLFPVSIPFVPTAWQSPSTTGCVTLRHVLHSTHYTRGKRQISDQYLSLLNCSAVLTIRALARQWSTNCPCESTHGVLVSRDRPHKALLTNWLLTGHIAWATFSHSAIPGPGPGHTNAIKLRGMQTPFLSSPRKWCFQMYSKHMRSSRVWEHITSKSLRLLQKSHQRDSILIDPTVS